MKKILIIIVSTVALLYAVALAVPIDPEERRPGTRLGGTLVDEANPDWSFVENRQQVYVQTNTWYFIPHSVTTISFVADDELYIPCGWCEGKQWPKNVAADPRVTVKIGERLYRRVAVKIPQEADKRHILNVPEGEPTPDFTLYRMDPPPSST